MPESSSLRYGDLASLVVYFIIMLSIGYWCSRRLKSTEGYFVGSRKIPSWAVAFSMVGAAISSVTFLAYPGSAFDKNWSMLVPGLTIPIAALLAVFIFVPFYRKAKLVSVYEYLEMRYGVWARIYGCIMFTIYSFFRMGVVLYLLSLPVKPLPGWDIYVSILVMGIIVTIYTVIGGIEAVIWTDVVQTVIFILGGLFCIATIFIDTPGGPATIFSEGWANSKFNLSVNFDLNFSNETLWVLILFGLFQNLQEFASDQTKIQRYCAADSDKGAKKAAFYSGVGCIPIWVIFMFVGTCLWVYYQHFPEAAVSQMKPDRVFPHFILTKLPVGLAGFVIAAIIAAALSSIDASMNGAATVMTSDIYRRHLVPGRSDKHYLNVAKILTAVSGLFMLVWALSLMQIESSILPIAFAIYSVLAGGLGGLFFVGIFSKRANSQGALIGVVLSLIVTIWMTLSALDQLPESYSSPFHKLMINVITNIVSFMIGYFASYAFAPPKPEQLTNLTIWTFKEDKEPA